MVIYYRLYALLSMDYGRGKSLHFNKLKRTIDYVLKMVVFFEKLLIIPQNFNPNFI